MNWPSVFDVSPAKVTEWKDEFLRNASQVFEKPDTGSKELKKAKAENDRLLHKVGQLTTMTALLGMAGRNVNPKRVRRLMRKMNLMAIYPQKCLSKGGAPKYFHPYLLRHLDVVRPNQVWSTDISYIPMKDGFMCLYAVIDVYSRFIVGWRLSNTLSANNCYGLMEDCIRLYCGECAVDVPQKTGRTRGRWGRGVSCFLCL